MFLFTFLDKNAFYSSNYSYLRIVLWIDFHAKNNNILQLGFLSD